MADGGGVERMEPPGSVELWRPGADGSLSPQRGQRQNILSGAEVAHITQLLQSEPPLLVCFLKGLTLCPPSRSHTIALAVSALNNESTLTWVADEKIFLIPTAGCKYFMFPPCGEKHLWISGVRRQVMNNQTLLPSAAFKIEWFTLYTCYYFGDAGDEMLLHCGHWNHYITIIPGLLFRCSRFRVVARGRWRVDEIWVDARRSGLQTSSDLRWREVGGGLATISTETTTATVQSADYEARERDAYCIK